MIFVIFAKALPEWFYKSYYHCFTTIKFPKPSWRTPQSMIPSIANPTALAVNDCTVRVYSLWRFLPPRNTPDSFCRRFTPTKSIAALLGRYFSLWETYLENFISRPDVIPTFRQRCCTNRGRNFVRSKRRPHYMSRITSTYFLRLNNSETIIQKRFWAQR